MPSACVRRFAGSLRGLGDTGRNGDSHSEVFVGRQHELGELERALDPTRAGRGATVLVAGEAGIGKTRLASELASRARDAGFEVLLGHSIDLVGTELPYQPFVEALRPLGAPRRVDARRRARSSGVRGDARPAHRSRRVGARAARARGSALGRHLDARSRRVPRPQPRRPAGSAARDLPRGRARVGRAHAPARRRRQALGLALVLELGPLGDEELAALLAAHADAPLPPALTDAIIARSEGNPFFAEELLAAAGDLNSELPTGLRDLLLRRVDRLDRPTQNLLRLAAAAGRDVAYPLLRAAAAVPERDVRESLRQAVEHGVLVADQAGGSFRFRHALLAEAIYATILPGEREELHARLAEELARSGAASPAEIAPHWAAAGRTTEALAASVEAARQAEAVFGLAEALAHLERALALWDTVPDAAELARLDLAELCSWTAELASQTGAAPRAVELARAGDRTRRREDPLRAARLYEHLGRVPLRERPEDAASPRSSMRSSSYRRSRRPLSWRMRWARSAAG